MYLMAARDDLPDVFPLWHKDDFRKLRTHVLPAGWVSVPTVYDRRTSSDFQRVHYRPLVQSDNDASCKALEEHKDKACKDQQLGSCNRETNLEDMQAIHDQNIECLNWRLLENQAFCLDKHGVPFVQFHKGHRDQAIGAANAAAKCAKEYTYRAERLNELAALNATLGPEKVAEKQAHAERKRKAALELSTQQAAASRAVKEQRLVQRKSKSRSRKSTRHTGAYRRSPSRNRSPRRGYVLKSQFKK